MKRRIFAIVLLASLMIGMVSCMNNIPCPAYASINHKVNNNRS